ncbi:MAG TPA: hypothetical protein VKX46_13400 [Ktedonobacteraceae bacterium]|nr:hypothetical protein [Ktedonobacteraceae bacterium]
MKRLSLFGLVIALLAILAITFTTTHQASNSAHAGLQSVQSTSSDNLRPAKRPSPPHNLQPAGHPTAIQPIPARVQAHILPTYTAAEVEQYLPNDPFIDRKVMGPGFWHTITFRKREDVQKIDKFQYGDSVAPILCYVEYRSDKPFTLLGTSGIDPRPHYFTKAYEVFDGQTGEALSWGALY